MIAPLLVLVAHGLDALTFLLAVERWGMWGESNPAAQAIYSAAGLWGLVLLKAGGAAVLAWIVARPRWRTGKLLFAAAAGVLGAAANITALII